jgi:hypothetical protein
MATHDPEFYESPKFSPEPDELRPRQRGCFFYGCVIASVLTVLLIIALALGAFVFYRFLSRTVEQYTSPTPRELPKVQITEDHRKEVVDRFQAFREGVKDGTASEPLVLTGDDLNALVEDTPELKGKVFFSVEGEKIKGQVSIPLSNIAGMDIGMLRGRYLNGEAEFKASLSNGILIVVLDSLEVNGQHLPDEAMANLRQQNLAKDATKDPKNAETIRHLESIEIQDGKIIIKPRPKATPKAEQDVKKSAADSKPSSKVEHEKDKSEAPKAEAPAPEPPKTKAAPAPATKDLSGLPD